MSRKDTMQNAMDLLNTIPKDVFQKCFNNGRTAGKSVCTPKETTVKGIRISAPQVNTNKKRYFCIQKDIAVREIFCTKKKNNHQYNKCELKIINI